MGLYTGKYRIIFGMGVPYTYDDIWGPVTSKR